MSIAGDQWAMLLALAVLWAGPFFLNGVAARAALVHAGLACIDGRLPRLLFGRRGRGTMRGFDQQV